MSKFLLMLDGLLEWSGKVTSILVYPCILVVLMDVVLRYVVHQPTTWAQETSSFMFGALCVAAGGYVMLHGGHICVDVISSRLPAQKRAILDMVLSVFFFFFVITFIWQGAAALQRSIAWNEHTQSYWGPPLWPIKMFVPIGGILLLLGGLSKFVKDWRIATSDRSLAKTGAVVSAKGEN